MFGRQIRRGRITLKKYIDVGVIRRNIEDVKNETGVDVLFMVKADAYGHGADVVAPALQDAVDMFGAATVDEGVNLRQKGVSKPVLVAVAGTRKDIETALENSLTTAVGNIETLKTVSLAAIDLGIKAEIHLKIDTGMHRLGFSGTDLGIVLKELGDGKYGNVSVSGAYSHLRCVNETQKLRFSETSRCVRGFYPDAKMHLASSSALYRADMRFDMVRVGLSAYLNAMSVTSEVITSRRLASGEHIGYGDYKLSKDTNTAYVFGGYADGIPRELPSSVCIRGKRCAVLNRACMDMFAVDTGDFLAEPGECAVLLGGDNPIDNVAYDRNTINYTVMTSFGNRCERIYVDY